MSPSAGTLHRVPQAFHEEWEEMPPEDHALVRSNEDIPENTVSVTVSPDGVMVPLKKEKGRPPEGAWREAACGSLSFHDDQGVRLHTLDVARMPESGKETLKARLAHEVAQVRALRPDVKVMAVADGTQDKGTFLNEWDPDGETIDLGHAVQPLREASLHARRPDEWFKKGRRVLRDQPDGVEKVIRALRYLRSRAASAKEHKTLEREWNFFRKNRHRMRCAEMKSQNLSIASGEPKQPTRST